MKSFVHIHTSFFVGEKWATFDIVTPAKNLSVFLQSFTRFYKDNNWHICNKDFPLHFYFDFFDYPDRQLNKLIVSGVKTDISLITYSRYINQVLSKLK